VSWILSLIPVDYFLYAAWGMIFLGLAFYVAAKLAVLTVYYKMADLPLEILSIVSLALGVYLYGNYSAQTVWQQRIIQLQHEVEVAQQKSAVVNTQIVKQIQVQHKVIHDKQIVIQERIKEVANKIDAECLVDKQAVDILNGASVYPNKLNQGAKP
jgi:hypothetical protein